MPATQGNGRLLRRVSRQDEVSACFTTRYCRLFQLLIGCLDSAEEQRAGLFSSGCEQKPGAADDAIPRRLHLVTEIEDGSHSGFLCFRYSATGRFWISRGKSEIFYLYL
jgi:hypothetical protein